ncbi:MAG TPA: hypothetical protein VE642_01465 [Pyrinomonadaceae bacterium]|jgi:hypothetical protein|nr:hypothetical protein [Pyrinomonadaceae bacterium]
MTSDSFKSDLAEEPGGQRLGPRVTKIAARLLLVTRHPNPRLFAVDFPAPPDLPSEHPRGRKMIDENDAWVEEDLRDFAADSLRRVEDSALRPCGEPISEELARELNDWQTLGVSNLETLHYEEDAGE